MTSAFGVELGKSLTGTPGDKRNTKYAAATYSGAQLGIAGTRGRPVSAALGGALGAGLYSSHRNSISGAKKIQDSRRAAHKRKTVDIPKAKAIREADVSKAFGRGIYRSGRKAAQNAEKVTGDVADITGKVKTLVPGRGAALGLAAGGIGALGAANGGATYLGARQGTKSAMKPPKQKVGKASGPLNLDELAKADTDTRLTALHKAFDSERSRHLRNDAATGAAAGGAIVAGGVAVGGARKGQVMAREAKTARSAANDHLDTAQQRLTRHGKQGSERLSPTNKQVKTTLDEMHEGRAGLKTAATQAKKARVVMRGARGAGLGAVGLAGTAAAIHQHDKSGGGRTYSYR